MKSELPPLLRTTRNHSAPNRVNESRVPHVRLPVGYRGISMSAKMVYGRLCRYARESGDAHRAIGALASEVGIGETEVPAISARVRTSTVGITRGARSAGRPRLAGAGTLRSRTAKGILAC